MSKHTPGPWTANVDVIEAGQPAFIVAEALDEYETNGEVDDATARANARLIAAAPDLLAICEELVASEGFGMAIGTWERLNAVVAKARGK